MKKNKNNYIILFDGVCNLCNSSVLFILKHDASAVFSFASLQSEKAKQVLKKHGITDPTIDSIIYIENGVLYKQSSAALHICKHLSGCWKYCYFLIYIPKKLRDSIYRYIAKHRYQWFGKKEQCALFTNRHHDRFI